MTEASLAQYAAAGAQRSVPVFVSSNLIKILDPVYKILELVYEIVHPDNQFFNIAMAKCKISAPIVTC